MYWLATKKLLKIGHLACMLAQFSIVGEDVLQARTPLGKGDLLALSASGMDKLKEVLLDQLPRYKRNAVEFEELRLGRMRIVHTAFLQET